MLRLPEPVRQRIAHEFRFAADKLAESADLATMAYFFSAFYGEVTRSLNQAWSADLALVHLVLLSVHREIKGRVDGAMIGDTAIGLATGFPEAFKQVANDWATLFEKPTIDERQLYQLMARTAEVGYVVTGNGYYLYLKGQIKV